MKNLHFVCICVCVRERERGREKETAREYLRFRNDLHVRELALSVCARECARERESVCV